MNDALPALPFALAPNRWKYAALLLLSLGFVAIGVFLLGRDSALVAWGCIGFFGLGAIVFALSLLPGANGLSLDENGFVVRSLFRSHRTEWKDVAGFRPVRIGARRMVGFDFLPGSGPGPRLRRANIAVAGVEAALPDGYGMSVDRLSALLDAVLASRR